MHANNRIFDNCKKISGKFPPCACIHGEKSGLLTHNSKFCPTAGVVRFFEIHQEIEPVEVEIFLDNVYNEGIEVFGLSFDNNLYDRPEFQRGTFKVTQIFILDSGEEVSVEDI